MNNFNLSIDLTKFWGATVTTTKSGKEVVVIPIEENRMTKGKNGAVYATLQATKKSQVGPYGDSHYIKPRFKKDDYATLSDEQKNSIPFVGSVFSNTNNNGGNAATVAQAPQHTSANDYF